MRAPLEAMAMGRFRANANANAARKGMRCRDPPYPMRL